MKTITSIILDFEKSLFSNKSLKIVSSLLLIVFYSTLFGQTTVAFQGGESTAADDWNYTAITNAGGTITTGNVAVLPRTGSRSIRFAGGRNTGCSGGTNCLGGGSNSATGCSMHGNVLTFNSINTSCLNGIQLTCYHRTDPCSSGSGFDGGTEGVVFAVSLNGGAFFNILTIRGGSDGRWDYAGTTVGTVTVSGVHANVSSTYPLIYNPPAGTTAIQFRATITANRADEVFYVDDVRLTTTSTGYGFPGNAGQWMGTISTDWNNPCNWHDRTLPTAATNVTISKANTTINCEVYNANAVCNNLTLTSGLAGDYDLIVRNSRTLTINNDALIQKTGGGDNTRLRLLTSGKVAIAQDATISRTGTGKAQIIIEDDNVGIQFSCSNLTMGGTGTENAEFKHEQISPSVTVNGNLTINAGGTLDMSNGGAPNMGTLNLYGNYSSNSAESDFKQTGSTIVFRGTNNQTINTNNFNEVFWRLTLNKPSGTVTLLDPIEIEQEVVYTSGIMVSSNPNYLIYRDNTLALTPSHLSHTNGPVRKIGNDAFTFPVGNGTYYRPIGISAPTNTAHHFTAQFFGVSPDAVDGVVTANFEVPLTNISDCEHWILDRTNGTSNVSVTLSYEDYSINNCSGVTDPVSLRVARWDAGAQIWRNHGGVGIGVPTGTITSSAAVTAFSPFALATTSLSNALPAKLTHFDALLENNQVQLTWSTESEINVDYFEILKSNDGIHFNQISTVDAVGNSSNIHQYTTFDSHPFLGLSYYRLNTVDNNGFSQLSEIKLVQLDKTTLPYIVTTPSEWSIFYPSQSEIPLLIEVYDAMGKLLQSEQMVVGDGTLDLNHDTFSKGIYLIKIVDGTESYVLKALR